jgi:hypothetical protein
MINVSIICIIKVIKCFTKTRYTIARGIMSPITPMSTKMGIKYPLQSQSPKLNTQGAPRASPPGPLSTEGAPPAGGGA